MFCSICKTKMTKGYLPARRGSMFFIPDDSLPAFTIFFKAKNGIRLSTMMSDTEAYYCPNCETVMISVPNLENAKS